MSQQEHAKHFMAPALFVAGVAAVIYCVAWGLGAADIALPWVVIVCLLVAAIAIRVALSRFGTDDGYWDPGNLRARRNRDLREFYRQRHPSR
jgi:hypothetical protein